MTSRVCSLSASAGIAGLVDLHAVAVEFDWWIVGPVPDANLRRARALPVPLPLPADWMTQREPGRARGQRAVVEPAVILQPCRMRGVGVLRRRRAKKFSAWLVRALSMLQPIWLLVQEG